MPDKVVNIDNNGKVKLVDTLTKNKRIKKVKGKPGIKLEDKNINGNIKINNPGKRLADMRGRTIRRDFLFVFWKTSKIVRFKIGRPLALFYL